MATNNDDAEKRSQFGNRLLIDKNAVFEYNAWDNVEWDEELIRQAQEKIQKNSSLPLESEKAENYLKNANEYWNKFYSIHENKFFKDRNWLFTEFNELLLKDDHQEKFNVFEVGCGVGNTIFPILRANKNPNMFVYCSDFSSSAIDILKSNQDYDTSRCNAFVLDLTKVDDMKVPFNEQQIDLIIMIFVLSAIKPDKIQDSINSLVKYLKPGGKILFRDYGLYDLAQLRFKNGQCIEENFYARGDGTLVHFFRQEKIDDLFTKAGLLKEQNISDKRLQINRGKQLKMYRVWIQAKYYKPKINHETFMENKIQ